MGLTKRVNEKIIKIKIPKKAILPVYADDLMDFTTERLVYYGGAGSGKSFFIALKVVITLLQPSKKPRRALVCRKYATTLEDSVFRDIQNQLEMLGIINMCKINKTTKKIVLPNKAEIIFKPLDDEHKVKSINGISLIWLEEASDLDKEMYNQLENRLRGQDSLLPGVNQQLILSFNPVSKANYCYTEFFDMGTPEKRGNGYYVAKDPRYKIKHTTYKDNHHLPDSFIKVLENYKINNPLKYEIYALGKFASLGQLVFPKFTVAKLDEWELRRNGLLPRNGIDFGYNDPTAIIMTYADFENRKIYIYKEFQKSEMSLSETYDAVRAIGGLSHNFKADSSRPETIRELYDMGLNIQACKKGHGSIMDGIDYLNDFEIIVDESCVNMIETFENYSYKKDKHTGRYLDIPVDDGFSHCADALRYAYDERDHGVKPVHKPY